MTKIAIGIGETVARAYKQLYNLECMCIIRIEGSVSMFYIPETWKPEWLIQCLLHQLKSIKVALGIKTIELYNIDIMTLDDFVKSFKDKTEAAAFIDGSIVAHLRATETNTPVVTKRK